MKKTIGLAIFLVILIGCATTYQRRGFGGGYSETQLDENIFSIIFRGNGVTGIERASDFTYLRAAELTLEKGFAYFAITDASKNISTSYFTTPSRTTTNINFYGNTAYATSHTTPGNTLTFDSPTIQMTIICFKEKLEVMATIFKAEFLSHSIRQKYKMKERS
jgi:hypothetical protein